MSMNRVEISGNLARDAELSMTASGTAILEFTVAVNDRRRGADGEWQSYADFLDCKIFGKRAESLQRWMTKGLKVAVFGKLRKHTWEDRETGQTRSRIDIVVDDIDLMQRRGPSVTDDDAQAAAALGASDGDIPF